MAYKNGMKKYDGMKMDHGMKQSKKEAMKEARGKGIDMGSMSDGNAMKKTGIYQDRENGMLKNHGMLKDLGMMQEEGMRGMRKMRGMYQEVKVTPTEEKEDEQKMLKTLEGNPSAINVKEKDYEGGTLDVKFGGRKTKISKVTETPTGGYYFPKGREMVTIEPNTPESKEIKRAITKYEYPFGKVTKK